MLLGGSEEGGVYRIFHFTYNYLNLVVQFHRCELVITLHPLISLQNESRVVLIKNMY